MTPLMQAVKEEVARIREARVRPDRAQYFNTFAKLIKSVRCVRDEARDELAETVKTDPYATPATLEDVTSRLNVASRAVQQFGATDSQINYLARLMVSARQTVAQVQAINTLTKGEASIMIDALKSQATV